MGNQIPLFSLFSMSRRLLRIPHLTDCLSFADATSTVSQIPPPYSNDIRLRTLSGLQFISISSEFLFLMVAQANLTWHRLLHASSCYPTATVPTCTADAILHTAIGLLAAVPEEHNSSNSSRRLDLDALSSSQTIFEHGKNHHPKQPDTRQGG